MANRPEYIDMCDVLVVSRVDRLSRSVFTYAMGAREVPRSPERANWRTVHADLRPAR
jgi:hypothetical protein